MKLRTSKRTTALSKKLSPRCANNGRTSQEKRGGGNRVAGNKKQRKDVPTRKDLGDLATTEIFSETNNLEDGHKDGLLVQSGVVTRRSAVRNNTPIHKELSLLVSHTRVLRSRNLNCTQVGETKSKAKEVEEPEEVTPSRQRISVRATRSSSPLASSSVQESCDGTSVAVKKVQFQQQSVLAENPLPVNKSVPGCVTKLKPKKKRRRRRKRSIQSVKSRRQSGGSVQSYKNNSTCTTSQLSNMHEDVAPSSTSGITTGVESDSVEHDNSTKDTIEQGAADLQIGEDDSLTNDSNPTSNTSPTTEDADKDTVSSTHVSFEDSTNESTSSFLDNYTSHIDYCSEEDLNLFRDEYCPNGVSATNPNSNPFGVSPLAPSAINLMPPSSSQTTPTSTETLFPCNFSSSATSWFPQSSSNQLITLPTYDNTSMFYPDSNGATCVPSSPLCKTGTLLGSNATSEYNSMMPCSSSTASSLASWSQPSSNQAWCGSNTTNNLNQDSTTDDESRSSWSHILEMSGTGNDNTDKDISSSQYNDHNMHYGVPSTSTSQELMQTSQQHDYSQNLMYSHGTNGFGQENGNMDASLITSCSPTTNSMTMPSPNYTYYTSKNNSPF